MARRHHYRRAEKPSAEINITTFLNLMVVLIPFLLITAVFSRMAVLDMNLPAASDGEPDEPAVNIEVVLRAESIELLVDSKPRKKWDRDEQQRSLSQLTEALQALKSVHSDKSDALLLVEDDIEYQDIIALMDAMRATITRDEEDDRMVIEELFPDISLGDAV